MGGKSDEEGRREEKEHSSSALMAEDASSAETIAPKRSRLDSIYLVASSSSNVPSIDLDLDLWYQVDTNGKT